MPRKGRLHLVSPGEDSSIFPGALAQQQEGQELSRGAHPDQNFLTTQGLLCQVLGPQATWMGPVCREGPSGEAWAVADAVQALRAVASLSPGFSAGTVSTLSPHTGAAGQGLAVSDWGH